MVRIRTLICAENQTETQKLVMQEQRRDMKGRAEMVVPNPKYDTKDTDKHSMSFSI